MAFEFEHALINTADSSVVNWTDLNNYIKFNNPKIHKIIKSKNFKKLAGMLDVERGSEKTSVAIKHVVNKILNSKGAIVEENALEQEIIIQIYFAVSRL
jgi:hypothetical protein